MLIIAGILFLLACLNITDGVAKISDLPDSMQVEFNVIFNNVDEIFNSTFLFINQMVYGIESSLVSLSKWLTEEGPKSVSDANSAVPLITNYEEVFTKPDQEYKTTKTQVDSSVKLNKEKSPLNINWNFAEEDNYKISVLEFSKDKTNELVK